MIPDSWLSPPKKILMVLKKQVRNMRGPDREGAIAKLFMKDGGCQI